MPSNADRNTTRTTNTCSGKKGEERLGGRRQRPCTQDVKTCKPTNESNENKSCNQFAPSFARLSLVSQLSMCLCGNARPLISFTHARACLNGRVIPPRAGCPKSCLTTKAVMSSNPRFRKPVITWTCTTPLAHGSATVPRSFSNNDGLHRTLRHFTNVQNVRRSHDLNPDV